MITTTRHRAPIATLLAGLGLTVTGLIVLGWLGMLPCVAGLAAVVQLWRSSGATSVRTRSLRSTSH
jgi:hypothetical protein